MSRPVRLSEPGFLDRIRGALPILRCRKVDWRAMAGDPKPESLFDRLLLGDTSMRNGNFKPRLKRSIHASIERGEVLLGCLHAVI
jgi:hypothetical protein